jgi:class 3 adenylate cyclase
MDFWEEYVADSLRYTRYAIALGILTFILFGVLDIYLFPQFLRGLWRYRAAVIVLLGAVLAVSIVAPEFFKKHSQFFLSVVILGSSIAVIMLAAVTSSFAQADYYYAGVMLSITSGFVFVPLRFRYALLVAFLSIVAYDLSLLFQNIPAAVSVNNTCFLISDCVICGIACWDTQSLLRQRHKDKQLIAEQSESIAAEKKRGDELLRRILPDPIANRLLEGQKHIADGYADVTVLFADLCNFTTLSTKITPESLVELLNKIFSAFDDAAEAHGVEKIKTIGDAYMAVSGLPAVSDDHPERMVRMGMQMLDAIAEIQEEFGHLKIGVRIGIHTGPCVAGVIGKNRFIYDLWGDTVNIASRMESHGEMDAIHTSEATYLRTRHLFPFIERGMVTLKGRGEMRAYLLKRDPAPIEVPDITVADPA